MSRGFLSKFSPVIILLILFGVTIFSSNAGAVAGNYLEWSSGPADVVLDQDVLNTDGASYCPTYYAEREVNGYSDKLKVCISNSGKIEFGKYFGGHSYSTFIKFPNDSKMRSLATSCTQNDDCLYMSESDTFVNKRFITNTIVQELHVYKNFSKKVKLVNTLDTRYSYYSFDDSNPDYVYNDGDSYAWPVETLAVSGNGRWLAVEIRGRGVGIFDPVKLEMRKVVDASYPYGMGHNPSMELAISNDGNVLSLGGFNVDFSMYYVPPSCGFVTKNPVANTSDFNKICPRIYTPIYDLFDRFYLAIHPWFSEDGSELSFYGISYTGQQKEIVLRAHGFTPDKVDYLAMGDSFSSGEGETSDKYYADITNTTNEKCHLSTRSYPYVLSRLLGLDPFYVKSVACSGATTSDLIGENINYWGQGGRLINGSVDKSSTIKTISQTEARENFIPGRVTQETFTTSYKPKFMTVGIGGNDVGFMEKLKTCISLGTCEWAQAGGERYATAQEIGRLYDTLVSTYQKLHSDSPTTIIYAIGYPKVIKSDGNCGLLYGSLLDDKEREFMNQGIIYLNQVIRAAASRAGVGYVDIADSLGEKVLCGDDKDTAMNAIRTGDDEKIIDTLPKIIGHESFHPNPLGHNLVANTIYKYLGMFNIYLNQSCVSDLVICPNPSSIKPSPSSYWSQEVPDTRQISQHFVSNEFKGKSRDNREGEINIDNGAFSPDSDISIEIHSDPIVLGYFKSDELGGFTGAISIPDGVPDGYHTIHTKGTSFGGDPLDFYQIIYIGEYQTDSDQNVSDVITSPNKEVQPEANASEPVVDRLDVLAGSTGRISDDGVLGATEDNVSSVVTPKAEVVGIKKQADNSLLIIGFLAVAVMIVAISVYRTFGTRRP